MNLYVFKRVLQDWGYGTAIIAAYDYSQALEIAVAEFGECATWGSDSYEQGWENPIVLALEDTGPAGLVHYVWGSS